METSGQGVRGFGLRMTRIFFKIQEDMTNPRQEILPLGILTIDENEDIVSWDLLLETLEKLKNIPMRLSRASCTSSRP